MNGLRSIMLAMVFATALSRPIMSETPPAAKLEDLAWLTGHWEGTGIDSAPAQESWSSIAGGQLVGHFRQLQRDGSVSFYVLITIVQRGNTLKMRLKHFYSVLMGWADKNTVVSFPLQQAAAGTWSFEGLTLKREGADIRFVAAAVVARLRAEFEKPLVVSAPPE